MYMTDNVSSKRNEKRGYQRCKLTGREEGGPSFARRGAGVVCVVSRLYNPYSQRPPHPLLT
jgi:hypothetical protein